MNRQEVIAEIVNLFEKLTEENKDKFIAALKSGNEYNQQLSKDSRRSVGYKS